ncbi:phnA protein [Spongorhabdus nitratireducens]
MAKGLQKHRERLDALNRLGKDLARRASSKCELCEAAGVSLATWEVAPVPAEPEIEHCLKLCETCHTQLEHPKRIEPDHWRCLGKAVWSQVPAAQVTAVRMLRQLSEHYPWAAEIMEHAYLEPEIEAWVENG